VLGLFFDGLDVADAEQDEEHRHVREVTDALQWSRTRRLSSQNIGD
jgi:hypothetical protein